MRGYLEQRAALIAEAPASAASARALSDLTDAAIAGLVSESEVVPSGKWAVCAVGGYGAHRLLPGSDLDLLVLTEGRPDAFKPFVSEVLYPLWDTGLKVGHQVRSARDHAAACSKDVETLNASLTARAVAGDSAFAGNILTRVARDARKRWPALMREYASRERPGSPYLLEPDLKAGAGAQRDLDELVWTAAVLGASPACDTAPLVELGIVSAEVAARLETAQSTITAARWALHRATGSSSSRIDLDVAGDLGIDLEGLQRSLADVHHLLLDIRVSLGRRGGTRTPVGIPAPSPSDPRELLRLAWRGPDALPILERLAWAGSLDTLVAGFSTLLVTRRPALAHRFTVGAHCLYAATLVADVTENDPAAAIAEAADHDPDVVVVAALTHDLGKTLDTDDHAAAGAPLAQRAALAFGLSDRGAERTADLVRQHLLLANSVASHDIEDEDEVLRIAARLGDRGLVWPLYVITAVDSLATGPDVWTPWRRTLVLRLARVLDDALSDQIAGAGIATTAEDVRMLAKALLSQVSDGERLIPYLEAAPVRFLATRTPVEAVAAARLAASVAPRGNSDELRVEIAPGPIAETWDVTVAAQDRTGLFSAICGAFSLSGLDILGAHASTDHAGIAIDTFTVRSATLAPIEHDTWSRLERSLHSAALGRLDIEARLSERRKHYPPAKRRVAVKVRTELSSPFATAIRVTAPDRPGLLHDIAREVSASGLDIKSVTALTQQGVAIDSFFVVDASGQPPREPGTLGQLAMRIRQRLRP
jgi:[protein-PII] uridylyltransferase